MFNNSLFFDIPFLDNLPNKWKLIPNRYLFKYDGNQVGSNWINYKLLSLTTKGVKEKDSGHTTGKTPATFEAYQTVKKGQIILCLFDLDVSAVFSGISNVDGMITSAYEVFTNTILISNEFADYWFKYVFSNRYYKIYSKSVRYTVNYETFKSIKTPVPPMHIQESIVRILKEKESKIDLLIDIQEKQIENIKEYNKSLIFEIITKGLDLNVSTKDSGVEWIGKIPSSWNVNKIKRLFYICKDLSLEGEPERVLKLARAGIVEKDVTKNEGQMAESYSNYNKVKKYDLLLNTMDLISGANCNMSELDGVISPAYANLRAKDLSKVNPKFYDYYFKVQYWVKALFAHGKGISFDNRWTLNSQEILNYFIPEPSFEEQKQIIDKLKEKLNLIESIIRTKEQKILKLDEYKKTLFYEYVTGKRTV